MAFKIVKKNIRRRLMKIIDQITEDYNYDCADNFRFYEVGNTEQKSDYEARRSTGCCGFVDDKEIKYLGRNFIIGFNYGH